MPAPPYHRRFRLCVLLAATACLGPVACVQVHVPPLPRGDLPAHWRNAAPSGSKPDLTGWWKHFHDPALNALVERALHDNLDVQQAAWNLRAARALEQASGAAFRPQLGFNTIEQPNPENTASYFQAGFDATWELGLFGRSGASEHIARARTGEAEAALQSARVSLVAEVVREYLQLRAAQQSEALLDAAARAAKKKLALLRVQARLQLASALDIEQGTAAAAKAEAQCAEPRAAIARHAQALALLLGKGEPDPAWLAARPLPKLATHGVDSVPADLLRTRPEIRYAETQVLKAAGELGIARADLYPRLALGSSLTFAARVTGQTRLGDVNDTFAIGPVIDIPLFDWGRRRAVRDARADQLQAALLAYRQTVLHGAAEVETDLAALHAAGQRLQSMDAAVSASRRSLAANEKLRSLDEADGLQVADAKLALADSELDRERARLAQGLAYVALYKALGGAPLPQEGPNRDASVKPQGRDAFPSASGRSRSEGQDEGSHSRDPESPRAAEPSSVPPRPSGKRGSRTERIFQ